MTLGEMESRVFERLEENAAAPTYYTAAEVDHALNQAQQTLAFITLCLEKTTTVTLQPYQVFYGIRNQAPDYLRPLRITYGDPVIRLRSCTLRDLDAIDTNWQQTAPVPPAVQGPNEQWANPPARYATVGCNLFVIHPQPVIATAMSLTHAYAPPPLVASTDVPLVPPEYHESLCKFALVWLRLKEGGQELQKVMPLFGEFVGDAGKLGESIRRRYALSRYDSRPYELARFDVAKLLKELAPKGGQNAKPVAG